MGKSLWYVGAAVAVPLIVVSGAVLSFGLGFAGSSTLAVAALIGTVVAAIATGAIFIRRGRQA
jgi:hypothetical protein